MQKIPVYASHSDGEKTILMVENPILNKIEVGSEFIPMTDRNECLYDATQDLYAKIEKIEGNKLICTIYKRSMTSF
jgi:hypothetical protein